MTPHAERFTSVAAAALGGLMLAASFWRAGNPGDPVSVVLLVGGMALLAMSIWPRLRAGLSDVDRSILSVALALTTSFGALSVQAVKMQVVDAPDLRARTETDPASGDVISNPRRSALIRADDRGRILDRNGDVLAETRMRNGLPIRIYPVSAASAVTGYFSPLRYGASGIESAYDAELSGSSTGHSLGEVVDRVVGRAHPGADVRLTIDLSLQREAERQLAGRPGAIVVIDVQTGEILVLASSPALDPNGLNAVDSATARQAEAYWATLLNDPAAPLLPRATQGLYTPGSTFKIVTASAALDTGAADPDSVYSDNGQLDVGGHIIVEANRPDASRTEWTLREGIAFSLNVVLAQVGLQLGGAELAMYAERFGFESDIPLEIPVARSRIASTPAFLDSAAALADTAFGQGELQATPLQMAVIAAAIANGGTVMTPHLVEAVLDSNGSIREQSSQTPWRMPVSAGTAGQMQELMINAVTHGYVYEAAIPGAVVGGKTGTAEVGDGEPHAWFIGFAGKENPRYAVAVVLEHGGAGLSAPVQIGRDMLQAALQLPG